MLDEALRKEFLFDLERQRGGGTDEVEIVVVDTRRREHEQRVAAANVARGTISSDGWSRFGAQKRFRATRGVGTPTDVDRIELFA